jgi:hypothetical protein
MAKPTNELGPVIERAKKRASDRNETRYVIQLDDGDERTWAQCPEDYLDSDEYRAFDGWILCAVFPDGKVERL